MDDREEILLPVGQVGVVVADEQQDVGFGLQRDLAQVGLDVVLVRMDLPVRIFLRQRRLEGAVGLLARRQLADGPGSANTRRGNPLFPR